MADYEFSQHAYGILKERNITEPWVKLTLASPDKKETQKDGTVHYIKSIKEHGNRYLRVIINPTVTPPKIITIFFDRRLGG